VGKVTAFKIAQPYKGTPADVMDFLNPTRTTAQIADIADSINTLDKRAGRRVYNTTLSLDYIADGPLAADTWTLNDGLGLTTVTPS
jgi:hypothetical protein